MQANSQSIPDFTILFADSANSRVFEAISSIIMFQLFVCGTQNSKDNQRKLTMMSVENDKSNFDQLRNTLIIHNNRMKRKHSYQTVGKESMNARKQKKNELVFSNNFNFK